MVCENVSHLGAWRCFSPWCVEVFSLWCVRMLLTLVRGDVSHRGAWRCFSLVVCENVSHLGAWRCFSPWCVEMFLTLVREDVFFHLGA